MACNDPTRRPMRPFTMAWLPVLLALWMASTPAHARDRCAASQLSRADQAFCAGQRLKDVDEAMGRALQLALDTVSDPQALRQQQSKWLRTVRDKCTAHDCLLRVYQGRTAELGKLIAASANVTDQPFSNDDAEAACGDLARLADRQRLSAQALPGMGQWPFADTAPPSDSAFTPQEKSRLQAQDLGWPADARTIYLLKLAPGAAPTRFATFFTGGSCPAYQTFNLPYLLDADPGDLGIDKVTESEESIRLAALGGSDYPILYKGRHFIVKADLRDPNKVNMISWVTPNGRTRPLCVLKSSKSRLEVASARQSRVCNAVARGEVRPLKWRDATETPPFNRRLQGHRDEFIARYGDDAEDIAILRTDLDRDGKAERIARFRHLSGAGCGNTQVWWSVLAGDLKGVQRGPLNDQLQAFDEGELEIYRIDGRFYISGSRKGQPGLFQINRGKTEQVCEFRQNTVTRPTRLFPLPP
jgi:uncharacterized protein YecT (DUF1311 family)